MSPDFVPPSRRVAPPPPRGVRLGDLARELGDARIAAGDAEVLVRGVRQDSRAVEPGDLFVARRGRTVDGARFVEQAVARGAVAVLAEPGVVSDARGIPLVEVADASRALALASASAYGHPTFQLEVVGITGTNGKTTTSLLVRAAIDGCGGRAGLIGTLGYSFDDLALPATHTSPEADDIARLARMMRDRGASHLVMEVSSIALAAQRVEAVRFRVAAFTNLTQDHLDFHGSMEAYAEAKARLFVDLAPGSVALNVDDPFGAALAPRVAAGVRLVRTSSRPGATESEADMAPLSLEHGPSGIRMLVRTPIGEVTLSSPLLGAHNVDNLLTALAVAHLLDLDLAAAARGIEGAGAVPGRLERCDDPANDDLVVLVDYAHTPDALARALAAVRPLTPGRVVCVFGCGGDRDAAKRPLMGEAAARGADLAILTNDNPRSEDPRLIAAQVMTGLEQGPAEVVVELDRAAAIRAAVRGARAGDVVLVAGKGHETYQIVGAASAHFDDREVARAALAERRAGAGKAAP
jgi:UDP-N-acetylmuramoyl-L-alanyl-D-glutamate--2,6-diaminopimelate ligase